MAMSCGNSVLFLISLHAEITGNNLVKKLWVAILGDASHIFGFNF